LVPRRWPEEGLQAQALLAGRHVDLLKDFVVISATDGNHGRALAAALGAEVVRVTGNYDESVQEAARLADVNGWQVVSDTSYEGYKDIPRDVMQGYGIIVDELLESATMGGPCPYASCCKEAWAAWRPAS
jgi:threonine dehydratase